MSVKWLNPSLVMHQVNAMVSIVDNYAARCIHSSSVTSYKTRIDVDNYLLDRSTPASDVLSKLTENDAKRLEKIKIEYQFLISKGRPVPKQIRDQDYLELLCLSKKQQLDYLQSLARKDNLAEKKQKQRLENVDLEEVKPPTNRFYTKFIEKNVKNLQINTIFQAMVLKNQQIVIDASFEHEMFRSEIKNLASLICRCYNVNKFISEPFHMVICGLDPNGILYQDLSSLLVRENTDDSCFKRLEDFPFTITDKHYLDMFEGKRLIYLSPDSTNFLRPGEYDHEAVYIIGGIVDKTDNVPLTLSRARREDIEHRGFPIDRYVQWKNGRKSLNIDRAFQIMTIARDSNGDWRAAIINSIDSGALVDKAAIKYELNQRRLCKK